MQRPSEITTRARASRRCVRTTRLDRRAWRRILRRPL